MSTKPDVDIAFAVKAITAWPEEDFQGTRSRCSINWPRRVVAEVRVGVPLNRRV
jgi:hypothetical protein